MSIPWSWTWRCSTTRAISFPAFRKNNFRVLEDNVPQQIASFNVNSDAPMTIAMVIEFSNLYPAVLFPRLV